MRRLLIALVLLLAAAAALPAVSDARKSKKPSITSVSPMRVKVGHRLKIRGRRFSSHRKRNTVVFKAPGGRIVFARVKRSSSRKLVVTIPKRAARILKTKAGTASPTRVRLKVLVRSRSSRYTSRRLSPVLVGKAASCGKGSDKDHDALANATELRYGLDPCDADTDGDGMYDGWEYWSAKDLNLKAVPYPRKRPYPNPLMKGDQNIDFDGDVLTAGEEFRAWRYTGSSFDPARAGGNDLESPLGYSDGTQTSRPHEVPRRYASLLDRDGNGQWSDDERDADADGMTNYHETHGPGKASWWAAWLSDNGVAAWPDSYYGEFKQRPFADLDPFDPDVDGDGVLDGADDQDNDGYSNIAEMYSPSASVGGATKRTNAFNPCAPNQGSRTCPRHQPFG
jgi:hypothetical protein